MDLKIKEYEGIVKRDNAYIVNVDDKGYFAALKRRNFVREHYELREKVERLEYLMEQLLQQNKGQG